MRFWMMKEIVAFSPSQDFFFLIAAYLQLSNGI